MRKKFMTKLKKVLAGVLCAATLMTTVQVPEVKAYPYLDGQSIIIRLKTGVSESEVDDVIWSISDYQYSMMAGELTGRGNSKIGDPEFAKSANYVEPVVRVFLKNGVTVDNAIKVAEKYSSCVVSAKQYDPNEKYDIIGDWYWEQLGIKEAWDIVSKVKHEKVKIAVLDGGMNSEIPDLKNIVTDKSIKNEDHGTLCSAMVAADALEGTPYAGIAAAYDNSVCDLYFYPNLDFAQALNQAIDDGMDIVSMSFGLFIDRDRMFDVWGPEKRAVERAYKNGIMLIASEGNDAGIDHDGSRVFLPADYDEVLGVSASKYREDEIWSAYTKSSITAPGDHILELASDGCVRYSGGTSLSAPLVAGVAAMVKSVNPELDNKGILEILKKTATLKDKFVGYGMVNAYEAVKEAAGIADDSITVTLKNGISENTVQNIYSEIGNDYSVVTGELAQYSNDNFTEAFKAATKGVNPVVDIFLKDGVTPDSAIEALKNKDYVVDADYTYKNRKAEINRDWYWDDLEIDKAWDLIAANQHKKVKVGIVENSGISSDLPDFKNVLAYNKANAYNNAGSYVASILAADAVEGTSFAGVASAYDNSVVELYNIDAVTYGSYAKAIEKAIEMKVDVLSLGLATTNDSAALKNAIAKANEAGIIVIANRSNYLSGNVYPADYDGVLPVCSTIYRKNEIWSMTSDKAIAAPGDHILAVGDNGRVQYTGSTYFAVPIVGAVAAMAKSINPDLTNEQIIDCLTSTAVKHDGMVGHGMVNAGEAVKKALNTKPVEQPTVDKNLA
nr:S8 family serine peptidase [Lachnospiraceae bacterium]